MVIHFIPFSKATVPAFAYLTDPIYIPQRQVCSWHSHQE